MGSTFIPSRCKHIDTIGGNVLIRGNTPLTDKGAYAFTEIQEASGVSDLPSRHLIEVPIIDNAGEKEQWLAIIRAFGLDESEFPSWPPYLKTGWNRNALHTTSDYERSVLWRPFEGLPSVADPQLFLEWPGWDFSGFVDEIIRLMTTCDNLAIYVHCQLGADRTGAFHIGYLMKSKGWPLKEAIAQASSATSAGSPNVDYLRLVSAYSKVLTQ